MSAGLLTSCRLRATPYTDRVKALGASGFSIVNHTVLPKGFRHTPQEDYWHLKSHVQIWDVGCQRQVEVKGPDAARLAQFMTPRDLSAGVAGQCFYAPMLDEHGGILNDPLILKIDEDHFWFSIADSDVLLWAKALAFAQKLKVRVVEPDVWPLAVQGPKSDDLMARVFGDVVRTIPFFRFERLPFASRSLVVARAGYSKQGGFEIYLDDSRLGNVLWDAVWEAGEGLELRPGSPNLIERIEGGLMSYGNEMTLHNNPFECGMDKYCSLDNTIDYIGREALMQINAEGPKRRIRGVIFGGAPCPAVSKAWPLEADGRQIGRITSAIWSPRFEANVALGMLERGHWQVGNSVTVRSEDGETRPGRVSSLPMTDQTTGEYSR